MLFTFTDKIYTPLTNIIRKKKLEPEKTLILLNIYVPSEHDHQNELRMPETAYEIAPDIYNKTGIVGLLNYLQYAGTQTNPSFETRTYAAEAVTLILSKDFENKNKISFRDGESLDSVVEQMKRFYSIDKK